MGREREGVREDKVCVFGGGGVKESEGGRVSLKERCDCFVMLLLLRCQLTRVR